MALKQGGGVGGEGGGEGEGGGGGGRGGGQGGGGPPYFCPGFGFMNRRRLCHLTAAILTHMWVL